MEEVNMAQVHYEKTGANSIRDSRKFAELMDYSAKDAAQYAIDCNIDTNIHGMSAQEYVDSCNGVTKEITISNKEEITTQKTEETPKLTKEVLQELLKANNIKFHPATGEKKLMILAKENGLLE